MMMDRMDRFLVLDNLYRELMYVEYEKLGLRYLPALQSEIERERQKIIDEDKERRVRLGED